MIMERIGIKLNEFFAGLAKFMGGFLRVSVWIIEFVRGLGKKEAESHGK